MAIGFVIDTTRPRYGTWTFGWLTTGAIQQAYQAWITQFGSIPGETQETPVVVPLKPIAAEIIGDDMILSLEDLAGGNFEVQTVGTPTDARLRLWFDLAKLEQGRPYLVTVDVVSVTADPLKLILDWCDGDTFEWADGDADPIQRIFAAPPIYDATHRFLDIRLADVNGSFKVSGVTLTPV